MFFTPLSLLRRPDMALTVSSPRASRMLACCLLLCMTLTAHAQTRLKVEVVGVSGTELKNVLGFLSIEQQRNSPSLSEGLIEYLHALADKEIAQALRPFGYYRPQITATLDKEGAVWVARYHIERGPPVRVSAMDVTIETDGPTDPEFEKLRRQLPLKPGDALEHEAYEQTKRAFQQLASERGYLDALFTVNRVFVDLASYSARVVLKFATGPRFHFGAVRFDQDVLNDDFLQRFVPFKEGDPYSVTDLLSLQKTLSDSSYFQRVEVRPRRELATGVLVPIEVYLEPRKPNRYTAGFGYGTDTGLRGSVGWERRRVNRRGHRMSATAAVSEIRNDETLQYLIPISFRNADEIAFSASRVEEQLDTGLSVRRRIGVSRSRSRGDWRESFGLNYQLEDETELLMPNASWTRTKADDRIYVEEGNRFNFDIRGASSNILSTTSFLQAQLGGKLIHPLGRGRIITRGDAGGSLTSRFDEVPISLRYYAGGDRSVRGYGYRDLSPRDAEGNNIGGKHFVEGSAEFEYPLVRKWSAAIFMDAGNAFNTLPFDIFRGVGCGVRWLSPVGLARLDVAWALDSPGTPWRIHAVIGPDL